MSEDSVLNAKRLQKISSSLNDLTKELFEVNGTIKKAETDKERIRKELFKNINDYIRYSGTMQSEVLDVKFASRAEAESYVESNHPGWSIIQFSEDSVVIEENPEEMRFMWTTDDGYEVNRSTAVVGTKFDFEKLQNQDPDLFSEIVESKIVYELNEKKAQELIEMRPELLPVLQENTKLGKIQLRLSSPKKVKDE